MAKCGRCGADLPEVAFSCRDCPMPLCASCHDTGPICGAHLDPASVVMQLAEETRKILSKLSPDDVREIRRKFGLDPNQ